MQYCPYCNNASTISVYYKDGIITRKCDNQKCKALFEDQRSRNRFDRPDGYTPFDRMDQMR